LLLLLLLLVSGSGPAATQHSRHRCFVLLHQNVAKKDRKSCWDSVLRSLDEMGESPHMISLETWISLTRSL
jgi:hypothetical protein